MPPDGPNRFWYINHGTWVIILTGEGGPPSQTKTMQNTVRWPWLILYINLHSSSEWLWRRQDQLGLLKPLALPLHWIVQHSQLIWSDWLKWKNQMVSTWDFWMVFTKSNHNIMLLVADSLWRKSLHRRSPICSPFDRCDAQVFQNYSSLL